MVVKKELEVSRLESYFESLSDPRHERNRKHRLSDILVIAWATEEGLAPGQAAPNYAVARKLGEA